MRLFMLWDMEGVSGIHRREQAWFWDEGVTPEVEMEGRRLLIADINSACAAALQAGVDELIVCDTHRGGGNIIAEEMLQDPRITYLYKSRGYQDGKLRWMPGLDETVDGFLVPGHHAMAGTPGAFLPHTWTLEWADFSINGQSVGEMGIEACFAAHWDIPVIFAQGDEVACREAEGMFPGIVTAPVKRPLGHDACEGPDLEAAHRITAVKLTEAVERLRSGGCEPFAPTLPMTVRIRMSSEEKADAAAARPGVERVDAVTVAKQVERHCDVVQWIVWAGLDMPERP